MPALTADYAPATVTLKQSASRSARQCDPETLTAALARLTKLLNASFDCSTASPFSEISSARVEVAAALAQLDHPPARGALTDALLATAESLAAHPAGAFPADPAALEAARSLAHPGWMGSLARVFAAPAWQQTNLRNLSDLAPWLWPAYARHLFAAPALFHSEEDETRWTVHCLAHLEPLVRMLESNRGSSSVCAAAQIAADAAAQWPSTGGSDRLRRRQHALGRLLALLAPKFGPFQPPAPPAPGVALRIGIVSEHASTGPGVFEAGRLKSLLDPERFEVTHHALAELPADTAQQVAALRAARLQAVIFAGDLTRARSPLAAVALNRVAACQLATALSPHTTGLPEIDGFLGDAADAPSAYTERLAVLPDALAFEQPACEEPALTRTDFNLPADVRLHAVTVHPAHFPVATRARWKTLLEADSSARILILPDASGPALELLLADLDRQFGDRLIIAGTRPLEVQAVAALLRVSDDYLASTSPGARLHRRLADKQATTLDCLAYADALAEVLDTACRSPGAPLTAKRPVTDFATRHKIGKDLLATGRAARASVYLLAAIDDPQAGPEVWHDLALALHADGQTTDAIQALETCVRLDPSQLEPWLLLADWALACGHDELVREIAGVVRELAPHDSRVQRLQSCA